MDIGFKDGEHRNSSSSDNKGNLFSSMVSLKPTETGAALQGAWSDTPHSPSHRPAEFMERAIS